MAAAARSATAQIATGSDATVRGATARTATDWIVIAKGIGIILVVMGHFYPGTSPAYWSHARTIVYSFHMPLFFILSGYLYVQGRYAYRDLIENKIRRLIYPFVAIAVLFGLVKFAVGQFASLESPVDLKSTVAIVVDPLHSYAHLLWFLQALFLIFCAYPLSRLILNAPVALAVFILVNEIFGNKYPFFGRALANLPFFAFGVVLRDCAPCFTRIASGRALAGCLTVAAFAGGGALQLSDHTLLLRDYSMQWVLGVVGSLMVINLSMKIARAEDNRLRSQLFKIGYYSMTIYFLHILFESGVRIAALRLPHHERVPFALVAAVAIAAGIVMPMWLERHVIRKSRLARNLVLGSG